MHQLYANVIVPRPLDSTFTYRVPPEMASTLGPGYRVIVPFGSRRFVTGIVDSVTATPPDNLDTLKDVDSVLDSVPMVTGLQLRLWHWLAAYYMCPIGDVMKAAMPGGMKVESETVVRLAEDPQPEAFDTLDELGTAIVEALSKKEKMSLVDLAKLLKTPSIERRITAMVERGIVSVSESLVNRYRRVKVYQVKPLLPRGDGEALTAAFAAVKRSEGQQAALLNLIALSHHNQVTKPLKAVSRETLLESDPRITWEHVKALVKKGYAAIEVREISRFSAGDNTGDDCPAALPALSEAQSAALDGTHKSFIDRNVMLLHGVTSSGKTELYIHLIDYTLKQNKQVLMLVPEIALTTQLTRRLQRVFGSKVRIYHSKFSDNERIDRWRDMLAGEPCVVIGARSAVFLPYTSLGLVIVDEEHDPSYKQADPAPRYNGRDAAIVLASLHGAKTLLGSATPSIETYYKATEREKYGLVNLKERYGEAVLPTIEVVDMAKAHKQRRCDGSLALDTVSEGRDVLAAGRQMIFFHNRRGYSPRARCRMCQYTPKCEHCDVSLTYHRRTNTLECHYCGAVYPVPKLCPACKEPSIEIEGFGTERIEDNLASAFGKARILRMDLDTTRNKEAYASIIDDFSAGKADILVGTQMVTKGLDFRNVGLVGIVNADSLIHFPDFRANERAFNLMEQVAGRAGRSSETPGKVLIQTYSPESKVIDFVSRHDYDGFYRQELAERREFAYPPFVRIIDIYIKHRDRGTVDSFARAYAARLTQLLGRRVHGPIEPPIERIASQYIRKIMLKIEEGASVFKVKDVLRSLFLEFNDSPVKSGVTVYYDVDPM